MTRVTRKLHLWLSLSRTTRPSHLSPRKNQFLALVAMSEKIVDVGNSDGGRKANFSATDTFVTLAASLP